jgi:hypothetical protein
MGLIARDWAMNYPPLFSTFQGGGIPHRMYGFSSTGAVNRFAARYRFAKEFRAVRFETYSAGTGAAYSSLCKFQFTFGAFEALRRAFNWSKNYATLEPMLEKYPNDEWRARMAGLPTVAKPLAFMADHLESEGLREQCRRALKGTPYNILLISQAVRNSFDHGYLTPNVWQADPADVRGMCSILIFALFKIMDVEFTDRVTATLERSWSDELAGSDTKPDALSRISSLW